MGRYKSPKLPRPEADKECLPKEALPELTDKQYEFIRQLMAGRNQSDAYREAYDTDGMTAPSVWRCAWQLRHNVNVSSWIDYLTSEAVEDVTCTKERHIRELESIKRKALDNGNYGAAV